MTDDGNVLEKKILFLTGVGRKCAQATFEEIEGVMYGGYYCFIMLSGLLGSEVTMFLLVLYPFIKSSCIVNKKISSKFYQRVLTLMFFG